MPNETASKERLTIGRIVGEFGLKGQVKVEPLTNIASRFDCGKTLWIDGQSYRIEDARIHKGRFLLRLEGIKKIEQAALLKWKTVEIDADDPPELEEDEYLVEDLIGLRVVDQFGRDHGPIDQVLECPAHDVLVVGDLMIPAVNEFVDVVDFEDGVVRVKLLEGMAAEGP